MRQQIQISRLIPHESAVTRARVAQVPSTEDAPIVVKPLVGTDKFYVYQGHNRVWKALVAGLDTVTALVAPPDFMDRRDAIVRRRLSQCPGDPIRSLRLVNDDAERQDFFFLDTEGLARTPQLNTHRGTMLRLVLTLEASGTHFRTIVLPQKGAWGGLVLRPELAAEYFREAAIDLNRMAAAWGDSTHDPDVLPAYVELGKDGSQCRGGGFALDVSFHHPSVVILPHVQERPRVQSVEVLVLYPDGNMWEGEINARSEATIMVLWDDALIHALADTSVIEGFYGSTKWWRTPTSLLVHVPSGPAALATPCMNIEHSCGSTCSGGGCAT